MGWGVGGAYWICHRVKGRVHPCIKLPSTIKATMEPNIRAGSTALGVYVDLLNEQSLVIDISKRNIIVICPMLTNCPAFPQRAAKQWVSLMLLMCGLCSMCILKNRYVYLCAAAQLLLWEQYVSNGSVCKWFTSEAVSFPLCSLLIITQKKKKEDMN